MVDSAAYRTARIDRTSGHAANPRRTQAATTISVEPCRPDTLSDYAAFAAGAVHGTAQHPIWVASWARNAASDTLAAVIREGGSPVMMLALEVVAHGPFRIARVMGGSHANGNFPAVAPEWAHRASLADLRRLAGEIASARPDIDLILLERQAHALGGIANPLALLGARQSRNIALAVDLTGGFEALMGRVSGKRKRKKHRSQMRKFEAAGGFRLMRATSPQEAERLLSTFFAMKERRFVQMGIENVFADPDVRAFFRDLFADALGAASPPFFLDGLEVGGALRAVTGSARDGERIVCEFGAIGDDELTAASPGDFLFFENIQDACRDGCAVYDFSVGDEPYKRQWCDLEITQFDTVAPLTAKGRLYALAWRCAHRAKGIVKNNAAIWNAVKRLRRSTAPRRSPADAGE